MNREEWMGWTQPTILPSPSSLGATSCVVGRPPPLPSHPPPAHSLTCSVKTPPIKRMPTSGNIGAEKRGHTPAMYHRCPPPTYTYYYSTYLLLPLPQSGRNKEGRMGRMVAPFVLLEREREERFLCLISPNTEEGVGGQGYI